MLAKYFVFDIMNEITLQLLHSMPADFGNIDWMDKHPVGRVGQLDVSLEGGVVLHLAKWQKCAPLKDTMSTSRLPSSTSTSVAISMKVT